MAEGPVVTERLDSWKEIAAYVGRTERTVMRWEQTHGLPIHRIPGGQRQAVYAWRHEIDEWLRKGDGKPEEPEAIQEDLKASVSGANPNSQVVASASRKISKRVLWTAAMLVAISALGAGAYALHNLVAPLQIQLTNIRPLTSDGTMKEQVVVGGDRVYFGEVKDGREIISMVSLAGGPVTSLITPFTNSWPESISAHGKRLLALSWNGMEHERKLWVLSLSDGHPQRVGKVLCHSASWSPDGREIAYAYGDSLFIASGNGTSIRQIESFAAPIGGVWWLPDGKTLRIELKAPDTEVTSLWDVLLTDEDTVDVLSLRPLHVSFSSCCSSLSPIDESGDVVSSGPESDPDAILQVQRQWKLDGATYEKHKVGEFPAPINALAADRKRKQLIVIARTAFDRNLVQFVPSSNSIKPFLNGIPARDIDFSRNGKWISYVDTRDFSLWTCRPDGSDRHRIVNGTTNMELPQWSPDGNQIAFMARIADKPWRIYIVSANGGPIHEASIGFDHQGAPTWSPDGRWLAYGNVECQESNDCAVHRIDLATRREFIIPGSDGFSTARWSPNGCYIAALNPTQQQVMLFDVTTGDWRRITDGINGDDLSWSSDSKYLYASKPNGEKPEILRIAIPSDKIEPVVELSSFMQVAGDVPTWFALAPDNSIIVLREGGAWEVYAMNYNEQ